MRELQRRFGQSSLAETHRANLCNIRKHSKESIQQYSARVSQLMSRAYPGIEGTPIYNNLAIEHLLRGLSDQKLSYEVLINRPRDFRQAVDMIVWHDACRKCTLGTGVLNVEKEKCGSTSEESRF